jgi:transposase
MMLKEENVSSQVLDHLGLVASVIKDIQLIEKIDAHIPLSKAKGAKLTIGQRVAAMILNGLGFMDDRLYMFPNFLQNKPVNRLFDDTVRAADFNDDSLGRGLDEIFDFGVTRLFSELAFDIGVAQGLLGRGAHFDTTSLSLYGEYGTDGKGTSSQGEPITDLSTRKTPIDVTYGYSKANRPDLKQVVLNLATTGAANFPIWMEACSGNSSDKVVLQAAAERMRLFCKELQSSPSFLYVGDSAMFERCVKEAGEMKWLSRVPERLKEAQKWLMLPDESFIWTELSNGYRMANLSDALYGDMQQRWLLVHSEHASSRELKTLKKNIQKEHETYIKVLWHLRNQEFTCEQDALSTAKKAIKSLKYHQATWLVSPIEKHVKRGRPKADDIPQIIGYSIQGTLVADQERIAIAKRYKGRFILASNELDKTILPDDAFLPEYKEQIKTEQGFRFIKSDTFEVDSIFLQKPSRIEALMMIMTLCLMVYSIAQYKLRQALEETNETVPDQLKKQTNKPTMAWVFRLFHGVHVWTIRQGEIIQTLIVNLTPLMKRIITYFGPSAEKIYALSG